MATEIVTSNGLGLRELRDRICSAREKYERGELRECEAVLEPFARIAPIQRGDEKVEAERMRNDPFYSACAWIALATSRLAAEIKVVAVHPVSVELALSCAEFGLTAKLMREADGRASLRSSE